VRTKDTWFVTAQEVSGEDTREEVAPWPGAQLSSQVNFVSTVYGPVYSWRLGRSLGIDLLAIDSICSFRCSYCQLGRINLHTRDRKVYVPTKRVLSELKESDWRTADVVTLSGSGEPTLAANLGEVIRGAKEITTKPLVVLTNATTLNDPSVRRDLNDADRVFCKLDAADEETFRKINQPVAGVTLCSVVEGLMKFREQYSGHLAVQIMLLSSNARRPLRFAEILSAVGPDEIQIKIPSRPRYRTWVSEARGNSLARPDEAKHIKTIGAEEAGRFEADLARLTGLKIVSACRSEGRRT
jgi:wyosine [tRNA(Phe)-imidazoG37] synthetase (radical SAM superfamily)